MIVCKLLCCISFLFYIKPQLLISDAKVTYSCISFLFYIKPQLFCSLSICCTVVFPFFSTSNHNSILSYNLSYALYFLSFLHQTTTPCWPGIAINRCISFLFYIKPQHLLSIPILQTTTCVAESAGSPQLYFLSFLHQTTTGSQFNFSFASCISFLFYIKPQPIATY